MIKHSTQTHPFDKTNRLFYLFQYFFLTIFVSMTRTILALLLLFSVTANAQYKHDSIRLKDGYLHFYTKGTGNPVVLLQGGPGFSSYYMRAIADSLSGYKCILLDYEGTGRSQYRLPDSTWVSAEKVVSDIELVRKKLNIEKWDVVGHSYGTHFGLYYSTLYSTRVNKLVLISSIGTDNQFQKYSQDNAMVRMNADDFSKLDAIGADSTLSPLEKENKSDLILLKPYFFNKDKIAPFINNVPEEEKPMNFSGAFFNAYITNPKFWTWNIAKQAYALNLPVRIIQGRQDFLTDGTQAVMAVKMKNATITYIDQAGHFSWTERPEVFYPLLRRLLVK